MSDPFEAPRTNGPPIDLAGTAWAKVAVAAFLTPPAVQYAGEFLLDPWGPLTPVAPLLALPGLWAMAASTRMGPRVEHWAWRLGGGAVLLGYGVLVVDLVRALQPG